LLLTVDGPSSNAFLVSLSRRFFNAKPSLIDVYFFGV
jgi:hypothetical protein